MIFQQKIIARIFSATFSLFFGTNIHTTLKSVYGMDWIKKKLHIKKKAVLERVRCVGPGTVYSKQYLDPIALEDTPNGVSDTASGSNNIDFKDQQEKYNGMDREKYISVYGQSVPVDEIIDYNFADETNYFENLPRDIIVSVFMRFNYHQLWNMSQVCKQWFECTQDENIWKNLCMNQWRIVEREATADSWKKQYFMRRHRMHHLNGKEVLTFGGYGSQTGKFNFPFNMVADKDGNLLTTDYYNHRVQVFDSSGTFLLDWGKNGTAQGEFKNPCGIAVDNIRERVAVADFNNSRVQIFDFSGKFLFELGKSNGINFSHPHGVAIDEDGTIVVSDYGNHTLHVFTPDGTFVRKWGSYGSNELTFNCPRSVDVHKQLVYIADGNNHRIQVYDYEGNFKFMWGRKGTEEGSFMNPYGVAVEHSSGYILVTDYGNNRVQVFGSEGKYISHFSTDASPFGIAVATDGHIYVSSRSSHTIKKY